MLQGSCRGPTLGTAVTSEEVQEGQLTALQAITPLHTPSTGVSMRYGLLLRADAEGGPANFGPPGQTEKP